MVYARRTLETVRTNLFGSLLLRGELGVEVEELEGWRWELSEDGWEDRWLESEQRCLELRRNQCQLFMFNLQLLVQFGDLRDEFGVK